MELTKESISLIAATGAIIGAIIAALITKIFEIFLENRKHHLTIQREYINRRLLVAEKAISQLITLASVYKGLATSLPNFFEEGDYVKNFNSSMVESYLSLLSKSSDMTETTSIHAYLDLSESIASSHNTMVVIQTNINSMQRILLQEEFSDQDDEVIRNAVDSITTICNSTSTELLDVVSTIRNRIKLE